MNQPQTVEGRQVWDLIERAGGQLRVLPANGSRPPAVLGWDMGALLALARALDVPEAAVAVLVPPIEAVMVREVNRVLAQEAPDGARGD